MKYAMERIAWIALCVLVLDTAYAQPDALAAIRKIYAAYNTPNAIRFYGSLKMYIKNNPGKIMETMQSSYIIRGTNFACSIGPVEMLLNDNYYVSVDKTIRLIMIGNKKDLSGTEQIPVLNTAQFKTWIEEKTLKATVLSKGTTSVLQLTDVKGITGYNLYNITYDAITGFMRKVMLEISDYNDASHKTVVLEITYSNPVRVQKNSNTFSEKHFFSVTKNKIQLTANYRNYQLINQL
jgi:hypothetical protein